MALESDEYLTISEASEGEYKEKGSKFIAVAAPVSTEEEAKEVVEQARLQHPKSRHHCFAWRLGTAGDLFRANDAGEPSGTAGKPILGQIDKLELTNVVVVVSRYFGGTLLGASGLATAYKAAASEALSKAEVVVKTLKNYFLIKTNYTSVNDVLNFIKSRNILILNETYAEDCELKIAIRQGQTEEMLQYFENFADIELSPFDPVPLEK